MVETQPSCQEVSRASVYVVSSTKNKTGYFKSCSKRIRPNKDGPKFWIICDYVCCQVYIQYQSAASLYIFFKLPTVLPSLTLLPHPQIMSPLSTITSLPLLFLLTLPLSVFSAPAPVPQNPATGTDEILPQYKITFAQLNSSRTETGGTVGLDSILKITVSGVEPGNLPVNCLGEWFFPQGTPLNYVELKCTDENVLVNLNQVGGEHAGVQLAVGVFVK